MSFAGDSALGLPALVLTAGLGTRLRPLSTVRAKAAVPVAGQPLVTRILRWLREQGVGDAVLNLHHLPESITSRVGDGSDLGLRVRYSWEPEILGSAGGPRRALPLLGASTFVVVNGDTLTDETLAPLVERHRASGALVTMAVVPNRWPQKYGGLLADQEGRVTGFVPRGSDQVSYHFFGVQIVDASVFERVPPDTPWESVGALYPALIHERPGAVMVRSSEASSFDIGTPADYVLTCRAVAARDGQPLAVGAGVSISPSAVVQDSVIWDDVTIDDDVRVSNAVVCDGVHLQAGTVWHDVAIRVAGIDLNPGERRVGTLAAVSLGSPTVSSAGRSDA